MHERGGYEPGVSEGQHHESDRSKENATAIEWLESVEPFLAGEDRVSWQVTARRLRRAVEEGNAGVIQLLADLKVASDTDGDPAARRAEQLDSVAVTAAALDYYSDVQ